MADPPQRWLLPRPRGLRAGIDAAGGHVHGCVRQADAIASVGLTRQVKGDDVDPHEIGSKWVFDDMWGFTADVSQPVLLEFFKALIVCSNADGQMTDAERAWCIGYCAATGATPETLAELQDYEGAEDILEVIERGRHLGTAHRPVIYDSIRPAARMAN